MVSALMLGIVSSVAQQAADLGGGISIADAVRVCMAAGLTFLIMRQVMPMAAGLASGLALSSFGLVSAALAWGLGSAARHTGQFGRGLIDRETTRWDPLSRKAGYYLSRGSGLGIRRLARVARPNTIARG
jgi:type IV secretion system protein VirB6